MLTKLNALKSAECRVYCDAHVIRNIAKSFDDNFSTVRPAPGLCSLQDFASLIEEELKFILSQIKDIACFDEAAVQVLRARIEYWCLSVNTIIRKAARDAVDSIASRCLSDVYELLSIMEEDCDCVMNDEGAGSMFASPDEWQFCREHLHRTPWVEIALTSVALIVVELLTRCPSCRPLIQYVSVCLIWSLVRCETDARCSSRDDAPVGRPSATKIAAVGSRLTKKGFNDKSNNADTKNISRRSNSRIDPSTTNAKATASLNNDNPGSDKYRRSAAQLTRSASDTGSSSVRDRGVKGAATHRPVVPSPVDDICKGGYIRTLIPLMLHRRAAVRTMASEIVAMMIDLSIGSSDNCNGADASSDVWIACLEQGLIPLLECIAHGIPVLEDRTDLNLIIHDSYSRDACRSPTGIIKFPELSVRSVADRLLHNVAVRLGHHTLLTSRAGSAMVHSGNAKLRMNMFVGLLLLIGRSDILGIRLLQGSSEASTIPRSSVGAWVSAQQVHQSVYGEVLACTVRDRTQFRHLLSAIKHFLACCFEIQQIHIDNTRESTLGSGNGGSIPDETALHLFDRIAPLVEPLVLINDGSRTTRMVCPVLPVIAKQSPMLADALKGALLNQTMAAMRRVLDRDLSSSEELLQSKLIASLSRIDDSMFITLEGSYNVWQEVFSHVVDNYLLESSVRHMSTAAVLEAFRIAMAYDMKGLRKQYGAALARALSPDNFVQVIDCALGVDAATGSSTAPVRRIGVDLSLTLQCIEYLHEHFDRIVSMTRPSSAAQVVLCVHQIILAMIR